MFVFFFFKQKTAYEIGVRLVGSEMCIRDRDFQVIDVDLFNKPEDIAVINPYNRVPVLVDRDLVLYESNIINEYLSLIHISEPTRRTPISYAVFCLKKKKYNTSMDY